MEETVNTLFRLRLYPFPGTMMSMLVKLNTPSLENTALLGIDAVSVEVEVACTDIGMP